MPHPAHPLAGRTRHCAWLGLLLIGLGAAHAQTASAPAGPAAREAPVTAPATGPDRSLPGTKLARIDAGFIRKAAQNGYAELELSELALKKSVNPQVKAFAQKMLEDHRRVNGELKALAEAKGVRVPTQPALLKQPALARLSARDGAAFDRHYVEALGVKAHEESLEVFRKAASDAKDPDIKAFAARTIPALAHHLQMARALHRALDEDRADNDNDARGGGIGAGGTTGGTARTGSGAQPDPGGGHR